MLSPRTILSPRTPAPQTPAAAIAEQYLNRTPCAPSPDRPGQVQAKVTAQVDRKCRPAEDLFFPEEDESATNEHDAFDDIMSDAFDVPQEETPMTQARAAPPMQMNMDKPSPPNGAKPSPSEAPSSVPPPSLLSRDYHGISELSQTYEERMKGLSYFDSVRVRSSMAITDILGQTEDAIRVLAVPEEHDDETWEQAAEWVLGPLGEEQNCRYLPIYGFELADGASSWGEVPSTMGINLDLSVEDHVLKAGHNWYNLKCKLRNTPTGMLLEWRAPRRLAQLRGDLHDRVKHLLGPVAYEEHFQKSRFAKFGGPPGTTARLNAWLKTLASLINDGIATPSVATLALVFSAAPLPEVVEPPKPGREKEVLRDVGNLQALPHERLGREAPSAQSM